MKTEGLSTESGGLEYEGEPGDANSIDVNDDSSSSSDQRRRRKKSQVPEYYVDPVRDVDIAPCLAAFCGCLPCCCCLYSEIDISDSDSECTDAEFPGRTEEAERPAQRIRNAFPVNKNILLMLAVSLIYGLTDSLWSGTVLSVYLLEIDGSRNDYIGYLEAVHGLSALLFSFPLGYMADKWSRSGVLKIGGILFLLTAAMNAWLLLWLGSDENEFSPSSPPDTPPGEGMRRYLDSMVSDGGVAQVVDDASLGAAALGQWASEIPRGLRQWGATAMHIWQGKIIDRSSNAHPPEGDALSAADFLSADEEDANTAKIQRTFDLYLPLMALWGLTSATINGPAQVLFAESVPAAERSRYFVLIFATYMIASTMGPLLSVVLFEGFGNTYKLSTLQLILLVGMSLEIVVGVLCLWFWDGYALEENKKEASENEEKKEEKEGKASEGASIPERTPEFGSCIEDKDSQFTEPLLATPAEEDPQVESTTANSKTKKVASDSDFSLVPYVLFATSLIISAGGGMTVKFFPLYFKNDIDLSPSTVQTIFTVLPLTMVIISDVTTRLSARLGRVQTIIFAKGLGVLGLLTLSNGDAWFGNSPGVLIPVFILRTAFMNSTYPLEESLLLDYVNRDKRARWKSMEGFSLAAWAGSAAVGGLLVDSHDYTYTFAIAAYVQAAGVLGLSILLPLVRTSESGVELDNASADETTRTSAYGEN